MAAILFTSGGTGVPKGAVYTHGIFAAQVEMLRRRYAIEPGEVDLATFPLFALFGPALLGSGLGGGLAPGWTWLIGAASVVPAFVVIPFTLLLGGAVAAIPRNERPNFYGIIITGIILALLIGALGGWLGMFARGVISPRKVTMIQQPALAPSDALKNAIDYTPRDEPTTPE